MLRHVTHTLTVLFSLIFLSKQHNNIPVFSPSNEMQVTLHIHWYRIPTTMLFALLAVLDIGMRDFCTTCTFVHYKFSSLLCLLYIKFEPFIPSWWTNISSYELVNGTIFQDCFSLHIVPNAGQHCSRNNLSFKTIIVWTMLLTHHQSLKDFYRVI